MSLAELRALAAETYDGVRQKVWTEPSPAAGADFRITVPGPQFWLPVALTATLTTSSTDGSREPSLVVTDGTTIIFEVPISLTTGPSLAGRYSWVRDLTTPTADLNSVISAAQLPCPALPTGWTIGVVTENIDSTDQWSAIALTALQITGGQPAQRGRRETAIREHAHALYELSEGR